MAPPLATVNSAAASLLFARDAASSFSDAKTTLSSWDNCMSKTYCKWPVIIVIIIVSLILLSLLFCLFRCLCCGVECCCGCLSCCNACCPKPRGSSRKNKQQYQPAPQLPPYSFPGNTAGPQPWHPSQQYYYQPQHQPQPQDTMMYGAKGGMPQRQPSAGTAAAIPQYARFSHPVGKSKGGEKAGDALPAMPSWQQAQERQIEDTSYHTVATGTHGEEGIPLQDRKAPMATSTPQPSTFGTPEYEQGYKSPAPPAVDEYSTATHDAGAYGFGAAVMHPAHNQQQQRQQNVFSPPLQHQHYAQSQQPYTSRLNTDTAYAPHPQNFPTRTVSPISTISSPPQTNYAASTPTSPAASSVYTARPPSYHTNAYPSRGPSTRDRDVANAPPMPSIPQERDQQGRENAHDGYGSRSLYNDAASTQQQQQQFSAYNPQPARVQSPPQPSQPSQQQQYSAYKPYSSPTAELDGSQQHWR